jgi:ketosteroid isomerase-like protein
MPTAQAEILADLPTVERLSPQFAHLFETFEVGDDVCADDIFLDLNMPVWRFQLQGRQVFAAQLKHINRGPVRIDVTRTVPTASGFVTEHVEHQQVGVEEVSARKIWLCEVSDGRIVHATCYCTGEWDDELRARHAVEAPMVRP